ncbi:MAG: aromatic ring-hydroxylating dioxygenase subunit alpha [Pseudomonadota bacterium]
MNKAVDMIKSVKEYVRMPLLYNHWYVAGLTEEFGRELKERTLLERSLVFYRTEAGELTALQNRCLHRSFPLSQSRLEGDNVVCGYHGIRYNPAGEIVKVPCQSSCPKKKLHKYPIREMGPFVFIWMGDPDAADESKLPDLPFLSDPNFRTFHGAVDLKGNYLFMHENLNDLTHFAYLHQESFKFDDGFFDLPTTVEKTDEGIFCNRIDTSWEGATGALPPSWKEALAGKKVVRQDGGVSVSPGVFKGYIPITVGDEGDEDHQVLMSYVMHYLTPETASTSHYWFSMSNDYSQDDDAYYEFYQAHIAKGFDEDLWAVEHMQNLIDNDKIDFDEMIIAGDQAGMLFRRVLLAWAMEEYGEDLSAARAA